MDLKYISKNDGYIIDRKFANANEDSINTYTQKGRMVVTEVLPTNNIEVEKSVTEYAFDNMKENILNEIKRKYSVSDEGLVSFYFEGSVEKDDNNKIYAKFENEKIPATEANFNVDFEIELKVTPRNFLKVQYQNLMYRVNA